MDIKRGRVVHVKCVLSIGSISISSSISRNITMRAFLKARVSPLIPHRHFWPRRTGERERSDLSVA